MAKASYIQNHLGGGTYSGWDKAWARWGSRFCTLSSVQEASDLIRSSSLFSCSFPIGVFVFKGSGAKTEGLPFAVLRILSTFAGASRRSAQGLLPFSGLLEGPALEILDSEALAWEGLTSGYPGLESSTSGCSYPRTFGTPWG